jgi:hypothetical protein
VKRYLTVEAVAERYATSPNSIHKLTMKEMIPFTRRPGIRRLLFDPEHLDQWDDGAALESVRLPDGGKLVRPLASVAELSEVRSFLSTADKPR